MASSSKNPAASSPKTVDHRRNVYKVYFQPGPNSERGKDHVAIFVQLSAAGVGYIFHVKGPHRNMKYEEKKDYNLGTSASVIKNKTELIGTIPDQSVKGVRKVCMGEQPPKGPASKTNMPGCTEWTSNVILKLCSEGVVTKDPGFTLPSGPVQLRF